MSSSLRSGEGDSVDYDDGGIVDDDYDDDGGFDPDTDYNQFIEDSGLHGDRIYDEENMYDDSMRNDPTLRLDDYQDDFFTDEDSSDMMEDPSDSGDSADLAMFLPRAPYVPEQKVLDTKAASGLLRKSGSNMMSDQLGTGDLLDDETSAAALFAVLGFMAVIALVSFISSSWHRTMSGIPVTTKTKTSLPVSRTLSPILKRRDHSQ